MFEILKPTYLEKAQSELDSGGMVYIGLLVQNDGSMPRHSGAWLMSFSDESFVGTLGGGRIELLALEHIAGMRAEKKKLDLVLFSPNITKMACGGEAQVAFFALSKEQLQLFFELLHRQNERRDFTLEIDLSKDEAILSFKDYKQDLTKPYFSAADKRYTEPLLAKKRIYIFGAGHIAEALAPQLKALDFEYVLIDDREDFVNKDVFAEAKIRKCCPYPEVLELLQEEELRPRESDFAVVLTKGHLGDIDVLAALSKFTFAYIGCIGSSTKRDRVAKILENKGVSKDFFEQVKLPIGLAILAESPQEIAISILSELILTRASLRR